ncbi:MAG TPA: RsmE family RNA methyltransferase [Thermoanaerobaculia bacterium]|nr:RsmE family RNA methyltransferase [Thermoanaerobaculia bacterium]
MRHRIFIDALEPEITVRGDEFHHAIRVVRAREGEEVELFDREGRAARGTIATIARDHAVIRMDDALPSRESPVAIHLAMAIIQLEKFELVLQKATELGVRSFIPLVTERVELRPERYSGKSERWQKIIFEAVKQSGRTFVPPIETPARFADVLKREGTKLLFDADRNADERPASLQDVTLLIGPEGGWSDAELDLAAQNGCLFATLGPRRLRAETAAIVAAAVITARYGDI